MTSDEQAPAPGPRHLAERGEDNRSGLSEFLRALREMPGSMLRNLRDRGVA